MSYLYIKKQLIQKSAADLLENELGWTSVQLFASQVNE